MEMTICNPLNLSYRYQQFAWGRWKSRVSREGADPSIVMFKGRYYLFASMSAGFWVSDDLAQWRYYENRNLPIFDYAPDIREIDGYLYFCASSRHKSCPIYRTKDPLTGFEEVSRPFPFWDPNLFQDDDGRVYLYWGCSNKTPLWGIEMDPHTMAPLGDKKALIESRPHLHGWERRGHNNDPQKLKGLISRLMADKPFIEGAWMTKHNGRYYLQYAAPGTEFNTYADGVYVGEAPLGPFVYAKSNPASMKPGGFICGAGHGSTLQDRYGNWWHAATMGICVSHVFERRVGLFPAGFDADGVFFCNQNFADYPMNVPARRFDPWTEAFAGWMLVSYRKQATATSSLDEHGPENALDESIRTSWAAAGTNPGEALTVDLESVCTVYAVQINFTDHHLHARILQGTAMGGYGMLMPRAIPASDTKTRYLLEGSANGTDWLTLADKREADTDLPHDYIVLNAPQPLRYIRIIGYEMPLGGRFALSGLRVFGRGSGALPRKTLAQAQKSGELNALISWERVPDADGYNIRYGCSPNKLYHSWLVYDQTSLVLGTLNKGCDDFVCVDSFNENGIQPGDCIRIKAL